MKPSKNRQFNETALLNNTSYLLYRDKFIELAQSTFAYENMPVTVNVRALEKTLLEYGKAAFFYEDDIGFLVLPFNPAGTFNVYGEPVTIEAFSPYNGFHKALTVGSECIIIYNNIIRKPMLPVILYYAQLLWDIDRSISVNARAQKTPVLIKTDEAGRISLQNLYKKYDGNEPVIYGKNDLDINSFTVLKTDAPFTGDKLFSLKQMFYSEMLSYMGITANVIKKERLLTDEMQRSQGSVIANRYSRLSTRLTAVEEINRLFNLNIRVYFRDTGLLDGQAQMSLQDDEVYFPAEGDSIP